MAILSEYEEENQKPTKPSSSGKPFNAALDPSNPLGFLEAVFDFVSRECDLFKSDSVVRDANAFFRTVKEKVDAEERKRREKVDAEERKRREMVEKRAAEERAQASASVKKDKKEAVAVAAVEGKKTTDGKQEHSSSWNVGCRAECPLSGRHCMKRASIARKNSDMSLMPELYLSKLLLPLTTPYTPCPHDNYFYTPPSLLKLQPSRTTAPAFIFSFFFPVLFNFYLVLFPLFY
ncbi:protein BOBBER 1 isoform X3 [Actinidia eriantha]|uniref:protein BOBBER 1 isoform X3 n=1 Tax=Actinidia eriantha TaxID=165200 RepID=UPI00258CA068|nr:protein BOBBER 1 isoform X3 [Actinidia eriantha]